MIDKNSVLKVREISTGRIEALSDGLFAIVMTLLVLEIKIPDIHSGGHELVNALLENIPLAISFLASFIVLGTFWIGHHNQFVFIKKSDREFLWLNILFLLFVSLQPFTTGLIGHYHQEKIAIIIYGLNNAMIGFMLFLTWYYGTKDGRLTEEKLEKKRIRFVCIIILATPVMYFIGMLFLFVNIYITLGIYCLIPVYYIFQGKINDLIGLSRIHSEKK